MKVYKDPLSIGLDGEKPIGEKRDWNQVHAFVNAQVKINESLPGLISVIEGGGFGISTKKEGPVTGNIRDDYQKIREDQSTLK